MAIAMGRRRLVAGGLTPFPPKGMMLLLLQTLHPLTQILPTQTPPLLMQTPLLLTQTLPLLTQTPPLLTQTLLPAKETAHQVQPSLVVATLDQTARPQVKGKGGRMAGTQNSRSWMHEL